LEILGQFRASQIHHTDQIWFTNSHQPLHYINKPKNPRDFIKMWDFIPLPHLHLLTLQMYQYGPISLIVIQLGIFLLDLPDSEVQLETISQCNITLPIPIIRGHGFHHQT
jgi:hypothetical protein